LAVPRPRIRLESPLLGSPMPAEQVGGDPEQPRSGVGAGGVEGAPPVEGPDERLGGDLLGKIDDDAPAGIAVERVEVPLEDRPEQVRIDERAPDHAAVRARVAVVHAPDCPQDARKVVRYEGTFSRRNSTIA